MLFASFVFIYYHTQIVLPVLTFNYYLVQMTLIGNSKQRDSLKNWDPGKQEMSTMTLVSIQRRKNTVLKRCVHERAGIFDTIHI